MIITDVKAAYPRWNRPDTGRWQSYFWQIAVRIETDLGTVGYGCGGGGEPGVLIIRQHLRHLLRGRRVDSVDDIRALWHVMYQASLPYGRAGIALMALSGVDLALWDLLGRAEGKPVHELIGGLQKECVRPYATGPHFTRYRDMGYTAIKFSHAWKGDEASCDRAVRMADRARQVFGREALLMVDCYMSWDADVTLQMAQRLAPFRPFWFEDVLTPDHLEQTAILRPQIHPILLAGGEHEFSYRNYEAMARLGTLDLWQPDVTWCGGLTAALRIVDLARVHGIPVVPHRGGEIWGLHLLAATDCLNLAETHPDAWQEDRPQLWLDEPQVREGMLMPPEQPGFGVRINEAML